MMACVRDRRRVRLLVPVAAYLFVVVLGNTWLASAWSQVGCDDGCVKIKYWAWPASAETGGVRCHIYERATATDLIRTTYTVNGDVNKSAVSDPTLTYYEFWDCGQCTAYCPATAGYSASESSVPSIDNVIVDDPASQCGSQYGIMGLDSEFPFVGYKCENPAS